MGYCTAVLILNDAAHYLESDPNLGKNMSDAMHSSYGNRDGKALDFPIGNHCNAGAVLPSKHADDVQVIVIGGNSMRSMATLHGCWGSMLDDEAMLRMLATQLGYNVSKKKAKA